MRALLILGAALWGSTAFADLPSDDASGWYSWQIDNPSQSIVLVRVQDGKLRDLHLENLNCWNKPRTNATDLGLVTPAENFAWFRKIAEDGSVSMNTREIALFGIVETESDEAFEYVEDLLFN